VPEHIKRLEPDLEPVFLAGKQIDERTGERLALWAQARKESSPPPLQRLPTDGVSLPSPSGAGGGAGPESAAAQDHSEASEAGPKGNAGNPASAAAPTDAEIVADIEKRVKRKDFDSAFDLARGIQDQDLNAKTVARINKALAFVAAKAAAK
jgi:hypothetical protein